MYSAYSKKRFIVLRVHVHIYIQEDGLVAIRHKHPGMSLIEMPRICCIYLNGCLITSTYTYIYNIDHALLSLYTTAGLMNIGSYQALMHIFMYKNGRALHCALTSKDLEYAQKCARLPYAALRFIASAYNATNECRCVFLVLREKRFLLCVRDLHMCTMRKPKFIRRCNPQCARNIQIACVFLIPIFVTKQRYLIDTCLHCSCEQTDGNGYDIHHRKRVMTGQRKRVQTFQISYAYQWKKSWL